MTNVLFICSRNQWRSPTAENIFRRYSGISVRSAGTSTQARRAVSVDDITWADIIFVMEYKHKKNLKQKFGTLLDQVEVHVLDIPDEYTYMDRELITLLEQSVSCFLE